MRDKQSYDRKRHKDIRINGKKAKMLGYSFYTRHSDQAECILLKTKIAGNYPVDLCREQDTVFLLEIPVQDGLLVIEGKFSAALSAPHIAEFGFEILSKNITAV